MLLVLKRNVSMRRFFFLAPITNVRTDGQENIHNFKPQLFVYLDLCVKITRELR